MNNITIAAGIVIIVNNRILFCHPTNAPWEGRYSFPKGHVEENEEIIDAAFRECKEETGIDLKAIIPGVEKAIEFGGVIDYLKKDKIIKQVHYWILRTSLKELGLVSYVIPKEQLQIEEVDWAGFLNRKEIEQKSLWRFKFLVKHLEI